MVTIALGAGGLCSAVMLTTALGSTNNTLARVVGASMLLWVAIGVARRRVSPAGRGGSAAVFATGLATAALNPVSGAYFLSASLAAAGMISHPIFASVLVMATAMTFFTSVALALGNPLARQAVIRWDRHVRITAAALLTLMALRTAWPLIVECV